jgi:MFS family permease
MFGTILLIPLLLQQVKGYGSFAAGAMMLPHALASGIMTSIAGRISDKIGVRPLVATGFGFAAAGVFLLSQTAADGGPGTLVLPLLLLGTGMGLTTMTLGTHVLQSVPKTTVGRVVPMTMSAQQVVMSFAVAGLSGYWSARDTQHSLLSGHSPYASMLAYRDSFQLIACVAAIGAVAGLLLLGKMSRRAEAGS